jgi:hypothetical protein
MKKDGIVYNLNNPVLILAKMSGFMQKIEWLFAKNRLDFSTETTEQYTFRRSNL